jgi:hypothetical protein
MPSGSTSGSTPVPPSSFGSDASAGDSGIDYGAAAQCSSGKTYTSGHGATMEPGVPCATCHGTKFAIAGTIYPTAHEPDRCDGADVTSAIVTITDANQNITKLTANDVGNFDSKQSITAPFTATVTYNGKSVAMTTSQTNGDCNSCHTQDGANGAPGRIVLP